MLFDQAVSASATNMKANFSTFLGDNAVSMLTRQFGADLALVEQGISAEERDKTFQRSRAVPSWPS